MSDNNFANAFKVLNSRNSNSSHEKQLNIRRLAQGSDVTKFFEPALSGDISMIQKLGGNSESVVSVDQKGRKQTVAAILFMTQNSKAMEAMGINAQTITHTAYDVRRTLGGALASMDIKAFLALGGNSQTLAEVNPDGSKVTVAGLLAESNDLNALKALGATAETIAQYDTNSRITISNLLALNNNPESILALGGNSNTTASVYNDGLKLTTGAIFAMKGNEKALQTIGANNRANAITYPDQHTLPIHEVLQRSSFVKRVESNKDKSLEGTRHL